MPVFIPLGWGTKLLLIAAEAAVATVASHVASDAYRGLTEDERVTA